MAKRVTLIRHANKVWQIDNMKKWKEWPQAMSLIHTGHVVWWQYGDEWFQAGKPVSGEFQADSATVRKINALPEV